MKARFKVLAVLDHSYRPERGTVTIDRTSRIFSVRRLRSRRTFDLPLDAVASLVVRKILQAENRERRAAKRKRRGRRSR